MNIIVGLGNPGEEYKLTRHNAGFLAVDALAKTLDLDWTTDKKCQALLARGNDLLLVKPLTFMNDSGRAIRAVMAYYRLLPKKLGLFNVKNADLSPHLTVIHDEIDIALGEYKFSVNSRSAGHRGVESIIDHLHTKNFTRLRLGIRTEAAANMPIEKFVLQKFSGNELETVLDVITRALTDIKFDRAKPLW